MRYISTRGMDIANSSMEAIVNGIANDSGLYVPEIIPRLSEQELVRFSKLTYNDLALEIISKYFLDLGKENIAQAINRAYNDRFEVKIENNFLELYHGPTLAFKDAALLLLPYLIKLSKDKLNINNKTIILTATSGDTGKAALEGFKNIDGIDVIVLYPKDGVSDIQKYQMITQEGNNLKVIAIEGNFDDAQSAAKSIFLDKNIEKILKANKLNISSANSINIGRLVPQIVYYFYAYFDKVNSGKLSLGEKINISVPTGNFGNILAAYYAKTMGLPIKKLICASNVNNVLTDFFNTGVYDINRTFKITETPSMDILISSNLERLLFEISDRDSLKVKQCMENLKNDFSYKIDEEMKKKLKGFYANYSTDEEVKKRINEVYNKYNYLIDTHTAVAYDVYMKYVEESKDNSEYIIVSTASPFKFIRSILNALGTSTIGKSDFELVKDLSKQYSLTIPNGIKDLNKKEIKHNINCGKDEIKELISTLLMEG
ncbi:threonine synthase [Clostridium massiliamazoniense]|uniref:threonine synthase n=1 Tax=Clostridium massiliamazoniense TaxID=1347366 RepID=UPI0006D7649B|nr:threonine synthase [Clostridium massiliamazoniense]